MCIKSLYILLKLLSPFLFQLSTRLAATLGKDRATSLDSASKYFFAKFVRSIPKISAPNTPLPPQTS